MQQRYSQSNGTRLHHLKHAIVAFKQENLFVSDCFTHLKGLWDELLNYRRIPSCTCGAKCVCGLSKTLIEYQHYDYIHSFLMGLNENFSIVKDHILLMEPLPDINKVFSLIQNHEKQRGIGILPLPTVGSTALFSRMDNVVVPYSRLPSVYTGTQLCISYNGSQLSNGSNPTQTSGQVSTFNVPNNTTLYSSFSSPSTALYSRMDNRLQSQYGKKDKPICSHCGFRGHTVDKCYKFHGYPPGFKGKSRAPVSANQVSRPFIHGCSRETQNLTHLATQCQQFLNMLTSQVQQIAPSNKASTSPTPHTAALVTSNQPSHVTSNMAGKCLCLSSLSQSTFDDSVFSSKFSSLPVVSSSEWIIDTGATDHMVINT